MALPIGWTYVDPTNNVPTSPSANTNAQGSPLPTGWTYVDPSNSIVPTPAQPSILPNGQPSSSLLQNLTGILHPGSPIPSIGQALGAGVAGIGKAALNLLSAPTSQSAMMDPSIQQMPGDLTNTLPPNPLANYPIGQKLGIPNTPMLNTITNTTANIAPFVPLALGGATAGAGILSRMLGGAEEYSSPLVGALQHSAQPAGILGRSPSSSAIATSLASKDFPSFMQNEMQRAQVAYAPATPYLDGVQSKVNLDPYNLSSNSQQPSDEELLRYLPPINGQWKLSNPQIRAAAYGKWQAANPSSAMPNILPKNLIDQLPNATQDIYTQAMNAQSGRSLLNLRSQLGSDAASIDTSDIAGKNSQSAIMQARNIVDGVLQNHLAQDPTGQALAGWRAGNNVYSQSIYPMQSNKQLEAMTAGKYTSATPSEVDNAVTNATRFGGLPNDHPIALANNNLQNVYNKEKIGPGILKRYLIPPALAAFGAAAGNDIERARNNQ